MSKPLKLFQRISSAWKTLLPQAERHANHQLKKLNPNDTFNPTLVLEPEHPLPAEAPEPKTVAEELQLETEAPDEEPEQSPSDPDVTLVPESNTEGAAEPEDGEEVEAAEEPALATEEEATDGQAEIEFVDEPFEEMEEPELVAGALKAEALLPSSWLYQPKLAVNTGKGGFLFDVESYRKFRAFGDRVFCDLLALDAIDAEVVHEMDGAVKAVRYALDAEYEKLDEKLAKLSELQEQADLPFVPPNRRSDGPLFDAAAREERERRRQAELRRLEQEQAKDAAETGDLAPVEKITVEEAPANEPEAEATQEPAEDAPAEEAPQVHPIAAINKALLDSGVVKPRNGNGRRKKAELEPAPETDDAVEAAAEAAEVA